MCKKLFLALVVLGTTLATVGCTTVRVSAKDQQTGSISVQVSPDTPVNVTVTTEGSLNPSFNPTSHD